MGQVLMTAGARAVTSAMVAGGLVFFSTLQTGASVRVAGVAAGVAIFTVLAARFGVEGSWDAYRARQGQAPAPPAPPPPPVVTNA